MLSLGRTAGPASWVLRHGLSRHALLLQEFYEEEREKRDSWGGTAGGHCLATRGGWEAGAEEGRARQVGGEVG